jgi:glycosyltransferase involved in cell wall biosynthesis
MIKRKRLRVSLVIPAYNEEHHIRACLEAIAAQTESPFEVIVVDNNCTDGTAVIARSFPFVRVVQELQQGLVHARDCGFNAARGEIIGRIDADTLLSPTWVAEVRASFQRQPDMHAISGSITYYDIPFPDFFSWIDLFFRCYLARRLSRRQELFLYGGNMALRRDVWEAVRGSLCQNSKFHEDMDMAAHMAGRFDVRFDAALHVGVSVRRIDSNARSFYSYVMGSPRTYAAHQLLGRNYMYPVTWFVLAVYMPVRLLYRSYNPATRRFSVRTMLRPMYEQRISPISE